MTVASLLRALFRRALTEPVEVFHQVTARLRHDPLWVLVKIDESLPARMRLLYRPLHRVARWWLARRPSSGVAAFGLVLAAHGLGRRTEVRNTLEARRGHDGRPQIYLARFATEIDAPRLALELLAPLDDDGQVLGARARAHERAGDLRTALELYEQSLALRSDPTLRNRRDRLQDDLVALEPDYMPRARTARPRHIARPGRIVHLLNNCLPYKVAGYTVRAHRTMLAQRDAGLEPSAITKLGFPWAQGAFDAEDRSVIDGVEYRHVRFDRVREVGTAEQVELALQRFAPLVASSGAALLHPTTPFDNGLVARGLRSMFGIPLVYEVRGFLEDTWLSKYPESASTTDRYELHRAAEGRMAEEADHVVTLGEAMKADLVERGVAPERITVVPNAVDVERFSPEGKDEQLAGRLGVTGSVVLGYVSSLVPYEGVEYLLEAVALLRERGHRATALIVGEGPDRSRLERRAEELGLGSAARFVGRVPPDEVQRYYELMDLFVVPRTTDRVCRFVTPLKPVEAMALERCVIVSDVPALEEAVVVGETGFTFRAEDPGSLADVASGLVKDPAMRESVGRRAREMVVNERTWQRNVELYRQIYASLGAV